MMVRQPGESTVINLDITAVNDAPTVTIEQADYSNSFNGLDTNSYMRTSLGDVDGDGDLDLVIGGLLGKLDYWQNDNGTFTSQSGANNPFNGVDVGFNSAPSLGDVDGDGDLDLVVGERLWYIKLLAE